MKKTEKSIKKNTALQKAPSKVKPWISVSIWLIVMGIIILIIDAKEPFLKEQVCPDKIAGNTNASLIIKYFYTPYCPYCWLEAPILNELVQEKGGLFKLEYYDYRFCREARTYRVPGVPSFVFISNVTTNATPQPTPQLIPGFIGKEQLLEIINSVRNN